MSGFDNTSETVRTTAVATVLNNNDYDLLVIGQTGNIVVSIPPASLVQPGRFYRIYKDAAAFTVTLTPVVGLIDGGANIVLAASAKHGAGIVSDGTNWFSMTLY